jgi:hypothetical protein
MNNTTKWVFGLVLVLTILVVLPFVWSFFPSPGRFGMAGYGPAWHMPMMYGGSGMMGFGMLFMGLISVGLLVLIGLGIAWLVKTLSGQK